MPEDTKKREEYAPITQGLREHLKVTAVMLGHKPSTPLAKGVLAECDNIDAIHKALEDANAEMLEFCSRLKDAAKKREDVTIFGTDYTALPLDADGVPIHVGDMMHGTCPSGKYVCGEVSAIGNNKFWLCNVQFSLCPDYMRHYHKPTVADVLREFADGIKNKNAYFTELAIAEYAKRLQLAEGDTE